MVTLLKTAPRPSASSRYIPDLDKRGEENYEGATNVGEWASKDGEVVAAQDRGHENLKQSSVALLVICVVLTFVESCCQRDANRRERKYKRFLVHPDRSVCRAPVFPVVRLSCSYVFLSVDKKSGGVRFCSSPQLSLFK